MPPQITAQYHSADVLFGEIGGQEVLSIREVMKLYEASADQLEWELRAFARVTVSSFRSALNYQYHPSLAPNIASISEKIEIIEQEILGDCSISGAAVRHREVYMILVTVERDQQALEAKEALSVRSY